MEKLNKADAEYLEGAVRKVLEPLIQNVTKEKPKDPMLYMFKWLKMYIGITYTQEELVVKEELINLRKEVNKYKKRYDKKRDIEEEVSSDEENNSDGEQARVDKMLEKNAIKKNKQRISVSAESFGKFNQKEQYKAVIIPKTGEQKDTIRKLMHQDFLFSLLDEKNFNTVIDAFEQKVFEENKTVITEGEDGNVVYLVESGELECYKKINNVKTFLKTYTSGQTFGELALLYNAPRAATIVSKTKSITWVLNRSCFNEIIRNSAIRKRESYTKFLQSVEILQTIMPYELSQICDALKPENVNKGTKIITQNEEGNIFYLLEEGEAYATKLINGKEEKVLDYTVASYFGELALLKDEPRAANVYAKTDCKLLTLDRMTFKRLLGPLQVLLERNSDAYIKYVNN